MEKGQQRLIRNFCFMGLMDQEGTLRGLCFREVGDSEHLL